MFSVIFTKIIAFLQAVILSVTGMGGHFSSSTATLSFDANPSTGYTWVCEMNPEGIVKVIDEHFAQPVSLFHAVGTPGFYTFVFSPVADGKTSLTFYYMRTWEGKDSATKTVSYDVTVSDGIINMGEPVTG